MPRRLTSRLMYAAERWLLKGMQYRLLLIAALIGLISIIGGALVLPAGGFDHLGEAIWWAFLRLSDPGYLGDDEGAFRRFLSTVLTVLGYVVFLGALVAIMTQWLNQTMRDLEAGLTPIARNDHILILGWTNHTPVIVREIVLSEARVRRFLRRRGARGDLHLVVLADQVGHELVLDLKDRLGRRWDERRVTFRSGTPLRVEHLSRVDFLNASVILIPAGDFFREGMASLDARTIKTLLSLTNHPDARGAELPRAVVELRDRRKIPVARRAYGGAAEVLASDSMVSRLIAQNVRHPGLSAVYNELLTHARGNEVYVREAGALAGDRLQDLLPRFPRAIPLGVARPDGRTFAPLLNPPDGFRLQPDDRLVLLARSFADAAPSDVPLKATPRGAPAPEEDGARRRRILVLGWSQKVPELLREFASSPSEPVTLDLLSRVPRRRREERLQGLDLPDGLVRNLEGDFTSTEQLALLEPTTYDNVVLLASDWLASGEESDARGVLGYLVLRELLEEEEERPEVLVELLDPSNASLLRQRRGEVLISPLILSHMLAQIALRPELRAVFDQLFGPGGGEIDFFPAGRYGLAGEEVSFADLQRAVCERGETALGIRTRTEDPRRERVELNPARGHKWTLDAPHDVVVLTTYG